MGMTLAEKILTEHSGKEVRAGEIAIVKVDLSYTQDGTGPLAVRKIGEMGFQEVYNPQKTVLFFDHASPSPRFELSNDHAFLREFARKTGVQISEIGFGISHQVVAEKWVRPATVVIGADSVSALTIAMPPPHATAEFAAITLSSTRGAQIANWTGSPEMSRSVA